MLDNTPHSRSPTPRRRGDSLTDNCRSLHQRHGPTRPRRQGKAGTRPRDAGAVSVSGQQILTSGQKITISGLTLASGEQLIISYGARAGPESLTVPGGSRSASFLTKEASSAIGILTPIRVSPTVSVRDRRDAHIGFLRAVPAIRPRGGTFGVTASRLRGACPIAAIYLGPRQVGSARLESRSISDRDLVVPADSALGPQTVSLRCSGGVIATTTFDVTAAADHRTAFVTSVPTPGQVASGLRGIAYAAAIVAALLALMYLIGFPAEWFNDTYQANRDRIRAATYRILHIPKTGIGRQDRLGAAVLFAFIVVGGLLATLSEDKPSLDRAHVWLFLGASLGFAAVTLGFQLPNIVAGRIYENHGQMRVLIGSVVIAAVCVLITRLLNLEPPYLYGLIAVYVFEKELVGRAAGRLTAAAAALVLFISLAAWAVDAPLHTTLAGEASPSPLLLIVDAGLLAIFATGLGSLAFGLLPLPFLPGRDLFAWNRGAWLLLFGCGVFCFVAVLLAPNSGYVVSVPWRHALPAIGAFAGFVFLSLAFMTYFKLRPTVTSVEEQPVARPSE